VGLTLSLFSLHLVDTTSVNLGLVFSLIVFLTFAVKLPLYGLHFWLPIAHVEAPTFGSMILAGVLLKLGGLGLLRLMFLLNESLLTVLVGYLVVFLLYSTLVCCFQSDFKRMVAYSSVRHMIAVPVLILLNSSLTVPTSIALMLFHGLASPVLFLLVSLAYDLSASRQLFFVRGVLVVNPTLSLLIFFAFLFTLSAPPFASFVREVIFILCSVALSSLFIFSLFFFAFLSLVYNIAWYSILVFGPSSSRVSSYSLKFSQFFSLVFMIFVSFPFILVFSVF
jgi:NADH:ubiquinone oxidoreductase subunit 4 (subunit M)